MSIVYLVGVFPLRKICIETYNERLGKPNLAKLEAKVKVVSVGSNHLTETFDTFMMLRMIKISFMVNQSPYL